MRISKYLIRSFFAIFAVVFGWIYVYGIGKTDENPCVVLGIMIGMGFAFYKITQWIYKVDDEKIRKWKKILFPLGIAFFGLQVCFTMVFRTENLYGWDFDTVIYLAKSYVEGTEGVSYHYLAAYSTNILYFWLVVAVFRVSSFLFGKCLTEMILILNIITLDFVILGGVRDSQKNEGRTPGTYNSIDVRRVFSLLAVSSYSVSGYFFNALLYFTDAFIDLDKKR